MHYDDQSNHDSTTPAAESGLCGTIERQLQEAQARYSYLSADFDTYRRRASLERSQAVVQAQAKILRDVVGIYDDITRALQALDEISEADGIAQARTGIALVQKNCKQLLERYGVVEMTAMEQFNPEYHEALMQVPATDVCPPGTIVAVLEKGYLHNGLVLRPARVSVAREE